VSGGRKTAFRCETRTENRGENEPKRRKNSPQKQTKGEITRFSAACLAPAGFPFCSKTAALPFSAASPDVPQRRKEMTGLWPRGITTLSHFIK
jgi:hypothetical protein